MDKTRKSIFGLISKANAGLVGLALCFPLTVFFFFQQLSEKQDLSVVQQDLSVVQQGLDKLHLIVEELQRKLEKLPGQVSAPNFSKTALKAKTSVVRVLQADGKSLTGAGSGFFVGSDLVVTNSHVIMNDDDELAEHIIVCDFEGEFLPLHGVAYQDKKRDIAIILLKTRVQENRALFLLQGDPRYTQDLQLGDQLAAIGHPLGFDFSVSTGELSGIRSAYQVGEELGRVLEGTWLQHTAPISPGNSGGPLLDGNGKVVGMNTLHLLREFGRAQNLNFAISSKDIRSAVDYAKNSDYTPILEPPGWLEFYIKSQL